MEKAIRVRNSNQALKKKIKEELVIYLEDAVGKLRLYSWTHHSHPEKNEKPTAYGQGTTRQSQDQTKPPR